MGESNRQSSIIILSRDVENSQNQHREANSKEINKKEIGKFREALPQVLASSAQSLMMMSIGMFLGFPTIVIPALQKKADPENLKFGVSQAAWYGSLTYLFQPFGSVISGALFQSIGCKRMMMALNLPIFGAWMLIYFASSFILLCATSALMGFLIGLMEAPLVRYVSEICHPSLRGTLSSYILLYFSFGVSAIYIIGDLTDWRETALISSVVPIISLICISQIPETPLWLMSNGRPQKALQSLQWLRGWRASEDVRDEFNKIKIYGKKPKTQTLHAYSQEVDSSIEGNSQNDNSNNNLKNSGWPTRDSRVCSQIGLDHEKRGLWQKWEYLFRKEMLVPWVKCIVSIVLSALSGIPSIRPFAVQVLGEFRMPFEPKTITAISSVQGILGNISCMILISRVGKKPLLMSSLSVCALCHLTLSAVLIRLKTTPVKEASVYHWIPIFIFPLLEFSYNFGLFAIPWIYHSEILPYRGRGLTMGITTAIFYLTLFGTIKSFVQMTSFLSLQGTFILFSLVCIAGVFFTYTYLPETEGKFLADIEQEITQEEEQEAR